MPLSDQQERLEAIGDQLRAKISSKFSASIFLAGFAFTVLAAQVAALWPAQDKLPALFPAALGAVAGATVLFVLAVMRLDELTMPKRFWKEDQTAERPIDGDGGLLTREDLWALQQRMIFFWQRLTITGTAITGGAVLLLVAPQPSVVAESLRLAATVSAGGASLVALLYGWRLNRTAIHRFAPMIRPVD